MSILTAFTTQVINLATELTNMYPEDSFFKSALTAVSLMKKTNPRLMHNLMMENVSQYREQVFAEDDAFFANQITKLEEEKNTGDAESDSGSSNNENSLIQNEEQFNFILRVRTYWSEMSPNTKKQIWMYLKVLFKLSDRLN
tara:strand:+ start:9 stop:434 length:426 start_codon:yes stop_codon:yes gene_type:complete